MSLIPIAVDLITKLLIDSISRADYVAWNGANPELCAGKKGLAKGIDASLRTPRKSLAQGTNTDLCKGAQSGLAKGSIFSQMKVQQMKCN